MRAAMRARHTTLLLLLGAATTCAAPPQWACSLPNTKNPFCPTQYQGDPRCSADYCPPHAGCTAQDCNTRQGNIEADKVIALDAYVVKGAQCVLSTFSAPECCNLCKITEGCNAWSYCNKEEGCGNGCSQGTHGFQHKLLLGLGSNIDTTDVPGMLNPAHSCTASGAWPYGVCSLKYVALQQMQSRLQQAQGSQDGWISGFPTAGAPAWHEAAAAAAAVAPTRALPADAPTTPLAGNTAHRGSLQAAESTLQEPPPAAAAATEVPPVHIAVSDEQDYEVVSYESPVTDPNSLHLTSDPNATLPDTPGFTLTETSQGALVPVMRGQQFPEGKPQYQKFENAPAQLGMITGPQDVQNYSIQAKPQPLPAAAKLAGNTAGSRVSSSGMSLALAMLMAVLALA